MSATIEEIPAGADVEVRIVGDSAEAVAAASGRYLARYHPLGYGTRLTAPAPSTDGRWQATGRRYRSCD